MREQGLANFEARNSWFIALVAMGEAPVDVVHQAAAGIARVKRGWRGRPGAAQIQSMSVTAISSLK
jgi:hypothetical protein